MMDEVNQVVSKTLMLDKFLVINQITNISISEWLGSDYWTDEHGMHRLVKEAMFYEANKILDERNRERNNQKREMELRELAQKNAVQPLAHNLGGIKNYFE
jgi:hypothetical protein